MVELGAASDSPEDSATGHGRKLDDVMLAMDVVDTLRHNQRLVERELSSESRDAELVDRLREIYAAQGIEVPDHVLLEGVDALQQQRFTYEPPTPGFATVLAKLYVKRIKWGQPLIIGMTALAVLWGGYQVVVEGPRKAALEQQTIELTQEIPNALTSLQAEIADLASVDVARLRARAIAGDGLAAAESGDIDAARAAQKNLRDLRKALVATFEIRIVSRPGEPSGVWRIPDANSSARNYYLIVEAVNADGKVVEVPITSEEDGATRWVSKWGLRVSREIFDAVGADKADDGIIQSSILGAKQRGRIEPEYSIPTPGGAILKW